MTKDEFVDWRRHPVTEDVFRLWRHRHDELIEMLVAQSHSMPPREQSEMFAAIKVYREILDMSPEDSE